MRAHILEEPGRIELRELPIPTPGEGEIVVRVRTALTCGTDLKMFLRGHPKFPTPTRFGHEFSGEVAAVGAGVNQVREGDEVMLAPTGPCNTCYYCAREQENLCETVIETMVLGAYGEFVKIPARTVRTNVYRKPPSLSFAEAALLEPLSCVTHGLEHIPLRSDDVAVILGAGAIALLHVLVLRARGLENIWVLGRNPERARHAARVGAQQVLTSNFVEAREAVLASTRGRGADLVIECTGQVEVWERAPEFARRGGTVILFGGCAAGTQARFDTQRLHYDQLRIHSPFHFTPRAVRSAYELLAASGFAWRELISGSFPLEDLPEALSAHRAGRGIKFAIQP
ncbi:MAG: alcohol dehydrogenase catalytic domain-containing protein [candidate division KSB1 bacterium]|nr:alcohol dehydrogenase catalytic domain-containing protein [candidate division KSB1 bacterium]